jgi:hypothetical protein
MAVHPPLSSGGLEAALFMNPPAAAIGAGGDKLQLAGLKVASVDLHSWTIGGPGERRESQRRMVIVILIIPNLAERRRISPL